MIKWIYSYCRKKSTSRNAKMVLTRSATDVEILALKIFLLLLSWYSLRVFLYNISSLIPNPVSVLVHHIRFSWFSLLEFFFVRSKKNFIFFSNRTLWWWSNTLNLCFRGHWIHFCHQFCCRGYRFGYIRSQNSAKMA